MKYWSLFWSGVVSLAAAAFLLVVVINPLLHKVEAVNQNALRQKTELRILENQLKAFELAQADLAKVQKREKILGAMVERENLDLVIKDLEQAADLANVEQSLKINEETLPVAQQEKPKPLVTEKIAITEVPYALSMEGDYQSLVMFFKYLEYLPHFTEVSRINLYAESSSSGFNQAAVHTGRISGALEGVFFVKKP